MAGRLHPVPVPLSTYILATSNVTDGANNQNLMLFIHGNAIWSSYIKGTNQFPSPPITINGVTMKEIMMKA